MNRLAVLRAAHIKHASRPINHPIGSPVLATQPQPCIQRKNKLSIVFRVLLPDNFCKTCVFAVLTTAKKAHAAIALLAVADVPCWIAKHLTGPPSLSVDQH